MAGLFGKVKAQAAATPKVTKKKETVWLVPAGSREAARERGVETVGDLLAILEKEGKVRIETYGFCCRGDREIYPVERRLV